MGRNASTDSDDRLQKTMAQGENQTTACRGTGTEILSMPAELDLATSNGVVEQGYAAIDRSARLLLLDLTGLSFCDARGLGAFVRIANHADAAGCRFGLIAPRPPVEKVLRISGLNSRIPVFATIDDALALLTAAASVLGRRRPRSRTGTGPTPTPWTARSSASTRLPSTTASRGRQTGNRKPGTRNPMPLHPDAKRNSRTSCQGYSRPRPTPSPRHPSWKHRALTLPTLTPLRTDASPGWMSCRPARTRPRAGSTRSGPSLTPAAPHSLPNRTRRTLPCAVSAGRAAIGRRGCGP